MRVTKAQLQYSIDILNNLTQKEWFLSQAYGGYNVVRKINANGGQTDLFPYSGHVTARELYSKIGTYCQGFYDAKT